MPILAEEPAVFPADLLESPFPAEDRDRSWWVLCTRPRQEKSVARELVRDEIPFYLPLVKRTRLLQGRKVRSHVPLFNGYVFLYGTAEERVQTLTTNRIAQVLSVTEGERLRADLRQVSCLIECEAPLTVEARLGPGRRVRIKGGAMIGLEGIVLRRCRQTRLVVAVEFLHQGVSVEVDDCFLEPID